MGGKGDAAMINWLTGLLAVGGAATALVFSIQYLQVYAKRRQPAEQNNIYYAAVFIRAFSIVAIAIEGIWLAWTYFDTRHKAKLEEYPVGAAGRLQQNRMFTTMQMRKWWGQLLIKDGIFFVGFTVTAFIFALDNGWLIKHSPPRRTSYFAICKESETRNCDEIFKLGLTCAIEALLWLFAVFTVLVAKMVRKTFISPERKAEMRQALKEAEMKSEASKMRAQRKMDETAIEAACFHRVMAYGFKCSCGRHKAGEVPPYPLAVDKFDKENESPNPKSPALVYLRP